MGSELLRKEPFLIKSYDDVIGVARNVNGLQREFARLAAENITSLQHHLIEGHPFQWLKHHNEKLPTEKLNGVESTGEGQITSSKYLENRSGATPSVSVPSRKWNPKKGRR